MTITEIIQIVLAPITCGILWLISQLYEKIDRLKSELAEHKTAAAKEYASNEALLRLDNKLDDIKELIISELKNTAKMAKRRRNES